MTQGDENPGGKDAGGMLPPPYVGFLVVITQKSPRYLVFRQKNVNYLVLKGSKHLQSLTRIFSSIQEGYTENFMGNQKDIKISFPLPISQKIAKIF